MLSHNKLKTVFGLSLSILCGFGIYFLQKPNLKNSQQQTTAEYSRQEQIAQTRLQILKDIPNFGFSNLIADWTYLNFIQYYGDREARQETGYSLAPQYFEIIVNRDPRFVNAHLLLSTATSVYAGYPKQSVQYLETALNYISPEINKDANFIWSTKAVDELLFLGNVEAAQHSFEMAAKWGIARGDEFGNIVAQRHQETAEFLASNPDSKKAQVNAWASILNNVQDDETRREAIQEIKDLGGNVVQTNQGYRVVPPEED